MEAIQNFLDGKGWPESKIHMYYGFAYVTLMWRDVDPVTYKFDYQSSTDKVSRTEENPPEQQ